MKFGSLFAGVGGFDLGFEAAGMECCFQVEWDKHCQQVLAHHWPDVPRWSDVSDVKGAELPPVDVITFGSPCQDLSVAGKRAGLDGGRSNLFFEATRIIREMRDATDGVFPRVAVWENVPGAFSSNAGHDFGAVLDGLAESGALGIEWAILDARWFGVPQRRRRIFVVAEYDPARACRGGEPILAVGKGSPRDLEKMFKQRKDLANEIVGSSTENCLENNSQSPIVIDRAAYNQGINAKYNMFIGEAETMPSLVAKGPHAVAQPLVLDGTRVNDVRVTDGETSPTLTSRMGTGGNTVPMMAIPIQGSLIGRQDHNGPGKGWGDDNAAMYTLTQMDPHFVATPYEVRRLTEIECERLMGWPDNHTLHRADGKKTASTQRYKMCGNGVASPVAKWVAEQIMAAEPTK
jgi:DNA (cytosine-5)-methyltransferase 1